MLTLIFLAGLWAGIQNALAGGGSFITLPVLMLAGLSPFAANLTSTVALFPGQVTTGLANYKLVAAAGKLPFRALVALSLAGGAAGAILLLFTAPAVFAKLLPWLILTATLLFAWGSFFRKPNVKKRHFSAPATALTQFGIAVYGGYFGGGIGFLMLAALTVAGMPTKAAAATKNVLAAIMNAAAVAFFAFSPDVHWLEAATLGLGAILGGAFGARLIHRLDERVLRIFVVILGTLLTLGLFLHQA